MAIDPSIALGIRPLQLADPLAQYSQFAQIQNAQNQNALAQYQLGAAQRAEAKDVARTNALLSAGTDEDAIAKALLNSGDITGYSAFLKAKEERQKTGLQIKESESKLLSDEIARSAEAMAKAQTIEEYEAIHNQVHDPKSITGKYFKSIGFNPSSANQAILKAKNDPTGQEFLKLRAQSGLKGKEFADFIFNQAQEEAINAAKNLRPSQPAVAAQPPVVESGQPMVGVQQYMPVSNALAPQIGGPDVQNAMVAKAIPSAAAPSTAQTPVSTNRFDSEITGLEQKIAAYENVPGEKARKLVDDLVKRRDKLVDQRRQESADTETKRAAEVREKLEREKHQLEIDKFNASQKEFKVEKTPQGLVQINKDGTVAPILGADGKQVQSLEFAKSEIKTNADGNYIAFNPYTNESRIITGADGKPVRSLDAATKAEQERHNRELERQGKLRLGLEGQRVSQESQRIAESKDRNVVANTVTDEAGNVRQFNKYGELVGDVKPGVGKPSAAFEKNKNLRIQLDKDLSAAIVELKEITKDGGLIDQSTGSGAGRLVDYAAAFGGKALPGAIATAKLKPIQDLVLKTIPRFEGPQSDKDTQSYKEAAGQLADPNMPTAIRKEAAKTVLRLMTNRKNQFVTSEIAGEGVGATGGGVDTNNPLLK